MGLVIAILATINDALSDEYVITAVNGGESTYVTTTSCPSHAQAIADRWRLFSDDVIISVV